MTCTETLNDIHGTLNEILNSDVVLQLLIVVLFDCRCVDYVRVMRGSGFGFTESCGTDASTNAEQFIEGMSVKPL